MSLLLDWLARSGTAPSISQGSGRIAQPAGGSIDAPALALADLAQWDEQREGAAHAALSARPSALDGLLLRLHFRRGERDAAFREGARALCRLAYCRTADIRYLNEFLWFGGADTPLREAAFAAFRDNLDEVGRHIYPAAAGVPDVTAEPQGGNHRAADARLTIGLLGYPHHFRGLAPRLEADGHAVRAIRIASGARSWRRALLDHRLTRGAMTRILGWRRGVFPLRHDIRDARVAHELAPLALDLAIHRIGGIIHPNLIAACGRGILNDHLAPLPWVRGRSSMEYSLLHGLPVGGTVHFIDAEVDTGPIVGSWFYRLDELGGDSLGALKAAVVGRGDTRLADAVALLLANGFATTPNPAELGRRYYTMAPALIDYVEAMLPKWRALAIGASARRSAAGGDGAPGGRRS